MKRENGMCTHYACRCARAAEYLVMADRTALPQLQNELLVQAIKVHSERVVCRRYSLDPKEAK